MISSVQRLTNNFHSAVLAISCLMIVCFSSIQSVNAQLTLTSSSGTATATCGQLFTVSIDATNGFTNLVTLQYSVNWLPAQAEYVSSSVSVFGADVPFVGTTNAALGELDYSWSETVGAGTTLPNGTVLLTMTFRAVATSGTIAVNITGMPTLIEAYDNALAPVMVTPVNSVSIMANPLPVTITPGNIACYGAATGSATAVVSGGTGPFNYAWSNGNINGTNTGLVAGVPYTVTVTGLYGCTGTASVTLTQPASAVSFSSITTINPNCQAGSTGSATATATGGTGIITYLWSTGAATATATGLTAGTYLVTATDASGCTAVGTAVLTDPLAVNALISTKTDVTCNGASTGSATVTASGGSGAYSYLWSANAASQTTAMASGLAAGIYTVTVTAGAPSTCTAVATVQILQPTLLVAEIISSVNITCNGLANGSATVNATGGTTPYTYAWPVTAGSQATATATNLASGTYIVTVTDNNGCAKNATVIISAPGAIVATASKVDVLCTGAATGSVSVATSGGTPGYTYLWSNGSADQTATGLIAGTYTVTVTDANGCIKTASATVLQPATALSASITAQTNPNCQGNSTGAATVTASGGTGLYTYLWIDGQTGATASNLGAGTYIVTVTDANGCTAVASVVLEDPSGVSATITAQNNVSCNGASTGSATVTAVGGSGVYTYLWSGGQVTATATSLAAGTYTVTVTATGGCTAIAFVEITQPTLLLAQIVSFSNETCSTSNNGTATVNATGGVTPYTYLWPATAGGQTTETAISLMAGTYIVTVTDFNTCATTTSVLISQPGVLTVAAAQATPVSCFSGSNGSATATPGGGTTPYTYLWDNGSADQTATGLTAGTHTVTLTDANGCSATTTVIITGPAAALTATASSTNISCFAGANGTASVVAAGGTSPYTYLWNTGANTAALVSLTAGAYEVTVTDARGCTSTDQVVITEPSQLTASITASANVSCFGGSNGTATVTAFGGTPAYSYNWPGTPTGDGTVSVTGLLAGTYTVTVSDLNLCTATATVVIEQPDLLVAQIVNSTNVLCFGGSTGTATVNATGGTTNYTYAWGAGAAPTSSNNTGLAANTYTVTVTDSKGCIATASVTITQPAAALGVTAAQATPVSCFGGSNGSATATPTNGTPGYTYLWDNGSADQTATGFTAGTHTVTVTDANGCTATNTVIITGPAAALTATASSTNISCFAGANGTASVVAAGGTSPYTYLWNTGANTAALVSLTAGTYEVTVTDARGCTSTDQVVITEPSQLTASITASANVSCFGGSNGTATVTAFGGTPAYSYNWPGTPVGDGTINVIGLAAGTYTVTVTDINLCTATATVVIEQPDLLVAQIVNSTNVLCFGGSTGTATVNATGGTTNYTYAWGAGAAPTSSNNTGLAANTYTVTVTDSKGCIATASVTITQPAAALTASAVPTALISCSGGSNGSATATGTNGTPGYTYLWSNGSADQIATGLTAGTYTVTITDANGCTASASVVVAAGPTVVTATIAIDVPVSCFAGADGALMVTASGGTTPYSYLWSTGAVTATITGLTAGTYEVTVTDANGCTAVDQIVLGQPDPIVIVLTNIANVRCFGAANGEATAVVTGGTSPYSYIWTSFETTNPATMLEAGGNFVSVTDNIGCSAILNFTITEPAQLLAQIVDQTNVLCNGGMTGSATVNATGGYVLLFSNYTYDWGGVGVSPASATNTGLDAGTYVVTVTDDYNCTATASVTISEPLVALTVTAVQTTSVSCFGGSNGTATATPANGTPGYTYLWSNGSADQTATGLAVGTHTVTVTDANGCTATNTVVITGPASALTATISGANLNCFGGVNGTATVVPAGGTPAYTYLWNNGAITATISGLSAGIYEVTVTDSKGCTVVKQITITAPAELTASITAQTNVSCFAGTNGTATVTATGGTPAYSYAWGAGAAPTLAINTGLAAGTYTVTVTDINLCTATATVVITQPDLLVAQIVNSTNVLCFGGSTGTATVNATGGTTNYTYAWGAGAAPTSSNNTGLAANTYTVTVTDSKGCIATASVTITQPAIALSVTAVQATPVSCFGGSNGTATATPVNGTPGYTYLWDNGSADQTATGLAVGTHTVTVTDANGCTATNTVVITGPASALTATISGTNLNCFGGVNGTATVVPAGGTSPYTYLWNNGAITATISGLSAGIYEVTVTDSKGCTIVKQITITAPAELTASITAQTNVSCFAGTNGTATVTATGGTPAYSYAWGAGAAPTSATNTGLAAGTYTVTVTDINLCAATATVVITQPDLLVAQIVNSTNVLCFGGSTGTATVNATGGTTNYTYAWGAGAAPTSSNNTGLAANTYTVTVTDSKGCIATASVTITQPAAALGVTAAQATPVSCFGGSNGSATATPTNGTPGYTYLWDNGSADQTATGFTAGTHTVTVTDANGCTATNTVIITGPAAALTATASSTNISCFAGANGTASVVAAGGTSPYTYLWNTGANTAALVSLTAGTYEVTVTDARGCTSTDQVVITEPSQLTASITASANVSCFGGSNGTATVTAFGGTPAYSYNWPGTPVGDGTINVIGLAAGTYTVTVTDINLCTATATVVIEQPDLLVAQIVNSTNVLCFGGSTGTATVNATGGTTNYTYAWGAGAAPTSSNNTGLAANTYTVTVTDSKGCIATASVTITQPAAALTASAVPTALISCSGGSNGSATATGANGTPGYTYLWSNGSADQIATGLSCRYIYGYDYRCQWLYRQRFSGGCRWSFSGDGNDCH